MKFTTLVHKEHGYWLEVTPHPDGEGKYFTTPQGGPQLLPDWMTLDVLKKNNSTVLREIQPGWDDVMLVDVDLTLNTLHENIRMMNYGITGDF